MNTGLINTITHLQVEKYRLIKRSHLVAEEGREHNGRSDKEETCPDQDGNGFGNSVFPYIHLVVDLESRDDGDNRSNGIEDVERIKHHRHHIVMHVGQSISTPAVVHSATLGQGGTRGQGNEKNES